MEFAAAMTALQKLCTWCPPSSNPQQIKIRKIVTVLLNEAHPTLGIGAKNMEDDHLLHVTAGHLDWSGQADGPTHNQVQSARAGGCWG